MTSEERIARFERDIRWLKRIGAALVLVPVSCLLLVAARSPDDGATRGTYTIIDPRDNKPKIVLHENGDVDVSGGVRVKGGIEVEGKLFVGPEKIDILAGMKQPPVPSPPPLNQLKVAELPVEVIDVPIGPMHKFWPVTSSGLGDPKKAEIPAEEFLIVPAQEVASRPGTRKFGDQILAAWLTPINQWHEISGHVHPGEKNVSSITRLEAIRVNGNQLVVVSSCTGDRPNGGCRCRLVVLYYER